MTISTLRPTGNLPSVRFGQYERFGLQRALLLAFGLAFAILLAVAPPAKAGDPDGGFLGGITGDLSVVVHPASTVGDPVTDILDPVTEPITEPVTEVLEPVTEPVSEVITEPLVEPIVRPVTEVVEPVLEPATGPVESITEPLVEPLIEPVLEPVTRLVEPITGPLVEPLVEPLLEPITGLVEPIAVDPVVDPGRTIDAPAPRADDPTAIPTPFESIPVPAVPALPVAPSVDPVVPVSPVSDAPIARIGPTVSSGSNVFDIAITPARASIATEAGPSGRPDLGSELALPWWMQLTPIGSFGPLGSGQALSSLSIGVAVALGLLVIFLMPPPFMVRRLPVAAVFWRPQAFVGPLERPG